MFLSTNMKNILFPAACGVAMIASSFASNAASNKQECISAISDAEQLMLLANISNEDINKVDTELQEANTLCEKGDFEAATKKIDINIKFLKAASN